MNGISSRQNAIGPTPTSMNGRLRPRGVWNESLHGPTIGDSVKAKNPSAPIARPINDPESVNVCRSGGSPTEIVVIEKARPNAPEPRIQNCRRRAGGSATSAVEADVEAITPERPRARERGP